MRKFLYGMSVIAALVTLSEPAKAATALPTSITVDVGDLEGGVKALSSPADGRILRLYTDQNGDLAMRFSLPAARLSREISLNVSFRQKGASDTFTFQAQNGSGAWVNVGTASGSTSFKSMKFTLPSAAIVNGRITVRLISNAGADDAALDYLAVADSSSVPQPNPRPSPTPRATPTPRPMPGPSPVSTPSPSVGGITPIPAGTSWYWQLSGTVNTSRAAKVYDIDLFENSASLFASLKASGHIVICYFSAGTYEPGRPDSSQFPSASLGSGVQGWPGEKWLDVRNATVRQIMSARMDLARSKGCDGVEPDNVDGYANSNGLGLTMADQVAFNTFLADQAHARGLSVALKNATDLVSTLVSKFDFAVVEECFKYNECSSYSPFVQQGKAVLSAEYTSYSSSVCSQAKQLDFSTAFYSLDLNGTTYSPCP